MVNMDALIAKKRELEESLRRAMGEIQIDESIGGDDLEKVLAFSRREGAIAEVGRLKGTLLAVERALGKLKAEDGSYGFCEVCGEEISPKRLLAIPETQWCIGCAEKRGQRK